MSVHGHGKTTFARPDDVSRRSRTYVEIPRDVRDNRASTSFADVLAETERGALMIIEARARAEEARIEIEQAEAARQAEADARAAKVQENVDNLMAMAADVFAVQLNQQKLFDRACQRRRFHALANGSMVDRILTTWRHATYDPKAYVVGFEYLTGDECMFVPPTVYRNQRSA